MSYYDPIPEPGLLTDQEAAPSGPTEPGWLRAHGYEWLAYQAYNPQEGGKKVRDLAPAKAAGLHAGIWGAASTAAEFYEEGRGLGEQAVALGAEFVIADIEYGAVLTRATRGMLPYVLGVRAGGWQGPVSWTQMGAPSNPRTAQNPGGNDYGCDERSFLETGGGVLPQEYANEGSDYEPALCRAYWLACGVPEARLNHTVAVYTGRLGRIDGKGWAQRLQAAHIGRNFSVFMAEQLQPYDAEGLDAQTKLPAPAPALVDPAACNQAIVREADRWLGQYAPGSKPLSRLQLIRRIAASSDSNWGRADRAALKAILDRAGL